VDRLPCSTRASLIGSAFTIVALGIDSFRTQLVWALIRQALERSQTSLEYEEGLRTLQSRHHTLSRREREVMTLVVTGRLNKQVGFELGISEITVKAHRGKVMRKMEANSLADLVTMAAERRLASTPKG
jgi:FixJ family two-component response regulator